MSTWNEKLKTARMEKGLSQQAVADRLGVTRGCYANYEQGTREPTIALLREICLILDLSADYLVGLTDTY